VTWTFFCGRESEDRENMMVELLRRRLRPDPLSAEDLSSSVICQGAAQTPAKAFETSERELDPAAG
jgi:hypothetical protein